MTEELGCRKIEHWRICDEATMLVRYDCTFGSVEVVGDVLLVDGLSDALSALAYGRYVPIVRPTKNVTSEVGCLLCLVCGSSEDSKPCTMLPFCSVIFWVFDKAILLHLHF